MPSFNRFFLAPHFHCSHGSPRLTRVSVASRGSLLFLATTTHRSANYLTTVNPKKLTLPEPEIIRVSFASFSLRFKENEVGCRAGTRRSCLCL